MASESKGGDDLDVGGGAAAFAAPLGPPSDPDSTPQALAYQGRLHALQVALAGKGDRQANAITEQDTDGRSLLHWAAAGGKQEALSYLLHTAGALAADALNRRDEGGLTPLASAAASGSTACITLLLDHGADANVASKGGQLPLMYHKGRVPVIAALLPATKDINMQDKAGATALHRAAGPGHLGAVQALLAAGARIDLQDRFGNTPLHLACEEQRMEVVKELLDHGADPSIRNAEGKDAVGVVGEAAARGRVAALVKASTSR